MGALTSKTTINKLSEQINNVAKTTVQTCASSAVQTQYRGVVNNGFSFWSSDKMEQTTTLDASCFNDVKRETDLQNKILETIKQAATSENTSFLPAFGKTNAEAELNLKNRIVNNITMKNIQSSYNLIMQTQSAPFLNNGVDILRSSDMKQGADLFAAATLKELDKTGILNDIKSYLDQDASSKNSDPFAALVELFGSIVMAGFVFFIVFIAIVMLGVGAWYFLKDDSPTEYVGSYHTTML